VVEASLAVAVGLCWRLALEEGALVSSSC